MDAATRIPEQADQNPTTPFHPFSRTATRLFLKMALFLLAVSLAVQAQTGFATSEITSPIKNLVTIANATIAGLAILAVIFYAIKWIGGDEGAAKRIIGVIVVAVIALGAANFLGWVTGKAEFDTFTN